MTFFPFLKTFYYIRLSWARGVVQNLPQHTEDNTDHKASHLWDNSMLRAFKLLWIFMAASREGKILSSKPSFISWQCEKNAENECYIQLQKKQKATKAYFQGNQSSSKVHLSFQKISCYSLIYSTPPQVSQLPSTQTSQFLGVSDLDPANDLIWGDTTAAAGQGSCSALGQCTLILCWYCKVL